MESYEYQLKLMRSRLMAQCPDDQICLNCDADICYTCFGCKCAPCDCPEKQPGWVQ